MSSWSSANVARGVEDCGDGLTPLAVPPASRRWARRGASPSSTVTTAYGRAPTGNASICAGPSNQPDGSPTCTSFAVSDLDQLVATSGRLGRSAPRICASIRTAARTAVWCEAAVVNNKTTGASNRSEPATARDRVTGAANSSRFGVRPPLGTHRNRAFRKGWSIRGIREPLHAEPWIESSLDVRDRTALWPVLRLLIFPWSTETITCNRLLSTSAIGSRSNTSTWNGRVSRRPRAGVLWHHTRVRGRAHHRPGDGLPMVGRSRRAWPDLALVVTRRDHHPFTRGIATRTRQGRMRPRGLLDEACASGNGLALSQYPTMLDADTGLYSSRAASLFAKSSPTLQLWDRSSRLARHASRNAH